MVDFYSAVRRLLLLALPLALLVLPVAAVAQDSSSYRIGPRDKVLIRVDETPEVNREYEVADDGTIELPRVGEVQASGLGEEELAQEITDLLQKKGVRNPTVSVRVTAFRSRPVSVLGAVMTPGNQYVPQRGTLLEVLLAAGGLAEDHARVVEVRRRADNGLSDQVKIQVDDLFKLGDPAVNIPVFAGDIIYVPAAPKIQISFLGEVRSPGNVSFSSVEPVTLLTALAQVGGLTENASPKLRIRRRGQANEIQVNFKKILDGREEDLPLEDGDLVIVKEGFF